MQNNFYAIPPFGGIAIIENELVGDPYEDWSQVRSHGRAARRRHKHPQRIVVRYRANGKCYHMVKENAVVMHPRDAEHLRRTLREHNP